MIPATGEKTNWDVINIFARADHACHVCYLFFVVVVLVGGAKGTRDDMAKDFEVYWSLTALYAPSNIISGVDFEKQSSLVEIILQKESHSPDNDGPYGPRPQCRSLKPWRLFLSILIKCQQRKQSERPGWCKAYQKARTVKFIDIGQKSSCKEVTEYISTCPFCSASLVLRQHICLKKLILQLGDLANGCLINVETFSFRNEFRMSW